jgi:hypothetical protein
MLGLRPYMAKRTITLDTKEIQEILGLLDWQVEGKESPAWHKRLKAALKTIKVQSAKQKGRKLQQDVCRDIGKTIGIPFENGVDGPIMSRPMGSHGADVILTGEARQKFPYSVECKSSEQLNLMEAMEQAKENQTEGTDWLLVHDRKKFPEPVAILAWSAFLGLFTRR